MRAIIGDDGKIMKLVSQSDIGVEIGNIPQSVGLERLRFIDNELIDLASLNEFWVDKNSKLYPKEIPGTQKVIMNYNERKKLIRDDNTWRVSTVQEIEEEKQLQAEERKRLKTKRKLQKQIGHTEEVLDLLIKAVLDDDVAAKEKLEDYSEIYNKENK